MSAPLKNRRANPGLLLVWKECSRPENSQKFPYDLIPDATDFKLRSQLRAPSALPVIAPKRWTSPSEDALAATLAIFLRWPPFEDSAPPKPTSRTASVNTSLICVESTEPPAIAPASSEALRVLICDKTSSLLRLSEDDGSSDVAVIQSFSAN